ncbi:MAG: DUF3732 domain-containing protein [Bacteroidota bacterium]
MAGLSSERFDFENTKNHFAGTASFRDTAAFQFQPQHIVANPFALFYKADTFEHQQKLKIIFPLLIGAITNEVLAIEREVKDVETQLRKVQTELASKRQAVNSWINTLKGLYSRSLQLGLLTDSSVNTENFDSDRYLFFLNQVVSNFKNSPIPLFVSGSSEADIDSQTDLLQSERRLQNELGLRKIRLSKLQSLNSSSIGYKDTVVIQQKRLEPISWFKKKLTDEYCPFCESKNETGQKQIAALDAYNEKLEFISNAVNTKDVNLDKEIADIRSEIRHLETELNGNREVLRDIVTKSNEEIDRRQSIEETYKFVGRLEQAIENVVLTEVDGSLDRQIAELQGQLGTLNKRLMEIRMQNSQDAILKKIALLISHYVGLLDIDRPLDPVELDITNLTLKIFSTESHRADFLWEVGSGANWMGYHLSTLFALHEHFLSLKSNYVPSFLFIDQPSQVYFPKAMPAVDPNITTFEQFRSQSDDLTQTRKIFSSAADCLKRTKSQLQIIIVEHAPEITWQGIEEIHLVEEWREENALIPKTWFE